MLVRWLAVPGFALLFACKSADSGGVTKPDLDSDPIALLPASASVVASLDAQAAMHAGAEGSGLAALADALVPVGPEAEFEASRDLDRVVIGEYGLTGTDVVAILSGRFNPDKIALATKSKTGAPIVAGKYVGFRMFTTGTLSYAPLTNRTLIAGTGDEVRRALERVQLGQFQRAMPPWVSDTVQTKGAQVAVAADFTNQPIATVTVGSVSIPWLKGLRVARILGDLGPPGLNVAATLTYADAGQAESAQGGVHMLAGWLKIIGPLVGGATVQNLEVHTDSSDLLCKFAVDDQTLRTLIGIAPRFLPSLKGQ